MSRDEVQIPKRRLASTLPLEWRSRICAFSRAQPSPHSEGDLSMRILSLRQRLKNVSSSKRGVGHWTANLNRSI